jgi:hypothetical protein
MRHNNKPTGPGSEDDPHLSALGEKRSKQLADWLPKQLLVFYPGLNMVDDVVIIAAANSQQSVRPVETMTPLSAAINVPIEDSIADKQFDQVARELFTDDAYAGKVVIVCWHHGKIPHLLASLHAPAGDYPNPWGSRVYNLIVKLDYTPGSLVPAVTRITEPF